MTARSAFVCLSVAGLFWAGSLANVAFAGTLPSPPAGFKVIPKGSMDQMRAQGVADGIEAEKPHADWPNNCVLDPKLQLGYGWQLAPGGGQVIEMMAQAPEEPVSNQGGVRDEPAGKQRYLGGVLTWRKWTAQVIGTVASGCKLKEMVTYNGKWAGYIGNKIVGVSVWHVYGDKATGQALIDEYAEKVKAVAAAGK
jgi:hypothetical protein